MMSKKAISLVIVAQFLLTILGFLYFEFKTEIIKDGKIDSTTFINGKMIMQGGSVRNMKASNYFVVSNDGIFIETSHNVVHSEDGELIEPTQKLELRSDHLEFSKKGYDKFGVRYNLTKVIYADTSIVKLEIDTNYKFPNGYRNYQGKFDEFKIPVGAKVTYVSK